MVKRLFCFGVSSILVASGCGPSLSSLVRDRHYREAVCAVAGGDESEVMDALVDDANVRVSARRLGPEELDAIDPRAAEAIAPRAAIVVIDIDSRRVPLDAFTAEVSFRSEGEPAGTSATREGLIWATSETQPRPTAVETAATGANVLLGLGYLATAGLPLLFGAIFAAGTGHSFDPFPDRGVVTMDAPESEYERLAPVATALYRALPVCDPRMGPTLRCTGTMLIDPALARGALHVTVHASARRIARTGEPLDASCVASREYAIEWANLDGHVSDARLSP